MLLRVPFQRAEVECSSSRGLTAGRRAIKKLLITLTLLPIKIANAQLLPLHFVHLKDITPYIQQDIRYYSSNNFTGRPVTGYNKPTCILTAPTGYALLKVQLSLNKMGLGLKVFDCYRPRMAVEDFVRWSYDSHDQKMKDSYYPRIDKPQLFAQNYISNLSGHSRGSTVDLTIINLLTQKEMDMGTHFDFLDTLSNPLNRNITPKQFENRILLRNLMIKFGFLPIKTEWWHFTLVNEPYKDTYFNFYVE